MKHFIIFLIKIYQLIISPMSPGKCRFVPTCSNYTIEAVKKYGGIKGTILGIKRVLKCNPFNPGGYDPVP
ncbi:MAG: membrane protein insertion efficiency factor YidD [Lutispora sp.]|nr:membrane protein insertion efficiency factor YidD [Lutispora sp.]